MKISTLVVLMSFAGGCARAGKVPGADAGPHLDAGAVDAGAVDAGMLPWNCALPSELTTQPAEARPFLDATDHSRRAEYLRGSFFELHQDGGLTCPAAMVAGQVSSCIADFERFSQRCIRGRSTKSDTLYSYRIIDTDGVPDLEIAPTHHRNLTAALVPNTATVVWWRDALWSVRARIVIATEEEFAVEGLLPPGATVLDDDDRALGAVVRQVPWLGVSVAKAFYPRQPYPTVDRYRSAAEGDAGVLESLLASARAVRIDGGAVGIGVAMGSLPDGRVLFLAPESLSKPCARARCVVGARDGGAGAPLEAKSHLFPEASFGFSIWALPDGDAVGATPFESEERLRRFEPVLLATIDGPLPGFVARGTGSLHSNVELDFGRRVAQGPVFSATTGRLVGFTRAVGESGEIRQLSRVTWVWDLLLGRKE